MLTSAAPVPFPEESVSKMENQRRAIFAASGWERQGSVAVGVVVMADAEERTRASVETSVEGSMLAVLIEG